MNKLFYYLLILFAGLCNLPQVNAQHTLPPNQPEQDACNALQICGNFYTPYSYQGEGLVQDLPTTPCYSTGEQNSVWFRLNVNTSGSIVFKIIPNDTLDDYDFAIVDITNDSCGNIQQSQVIRCNFNNNEQPNTYYSGGIIGLNTVSNLLYVTGGAYGEPFLKEITASAGDEYLIMINNFGHDDCSGTCPGSGFLLDFTGSTATFNEPPSPALDSIETQCDYSDSIIVTLTENTLCSSIAGDGSDFYLTPNGIVDSAVDIACSGLNGYTKKLKLYFRNSLPDGDYVLHAQVGSDTNTLLGLCHAALQLPDTLHFHVGYPPIQFTIDPPACQILHLQLDTMIHCSSIAADGSDFRIVGPSQVLINGADGVNCSSGYTQQVDVHLAQPIALDGQYNLVAQLGNDGNILVGDCGRRVFNNSSVPFQVNSFNGLLTAGPDTTTCFDHLNLYSQNNGTAPAGGFQYNWSPTTGIQNPTAPNSRVDLHLGYQSYLLTTIDSFGCYLRDSVSIIAHQQPTADFSYDIGLSCFGGDTVFFHNHSLYGNEYLWDFGRLNLTDTAMNTQQIYPSGTYNVSLRVSNENCVDSLVRIINLPDHTLSADFSTSADTVCEGTKVSFTNQSTASTVNNISPSYKWFFGDGAESIQESPNHFYDTPGIYRVKLIVTNGIPCNDSLERTIVVFPKVSLSVSLSDTPICKGDEVVFNSLYTLDGLKEIVWRFGDTPDSAWNTNPISHSYDKSGVYQAMVSARYKVCPDTSLSFTIRVKDLPYLDLGADTTMCLDGNPIVVRDKINQSNPAASWLWSTGDTTSSLMIRHPGHYWARVTVDYCSTRDDITIKKDCYLEVPNSFTPNGDGENDYFLPRQLLSKGVAGFRMQIWNRWGEKIFSTSSLNGRGWDGNFNGKEQPVGVYVYIIEVHYKNGRQETYRGNVTLLR